MTADKNTPSAELVIERTFDAPRSVVWKAWTQPEHMKKWWGPKDFTAPTIKIDFKEGGKYHFCMRGAMGPGMDLQDFWSTGRYIEIIPEEKLVMTDSFSDAEGNIVSAETYGMKDMPLEMEVTVTFEDLGDKTKMTLRHKGMQVGEMKEMTGAGWNQSFDKLESCVATM